MTIASAGGSGFSKAGRDWPRREEPVSLTVRGADGREMPIAPASVDRMRHTVNFNQYGGTCYELRLWSEGRRVTLDEGSRDAIRELARQVAARHGVGRLEIGMDWGTSIFYLIVVAIGVLALGFIAYLLVTQGGDLWFASPFIPLLGFVIYRNMRGRWPPRRAGSLERFLAVLDRP